MNHQYLLERVPLRLRPLTEDDAVIMVRWRNKERIRQQFISQTPISLEGHLGWFRHYLANDNDIMFIIEEFTDLKKPIGAVGLYNINESIKLCEFGRIMIGEDDALGKGYAKTAIMMIIDFAYQCLDLNQINLEVYQDNNRAIGLYSSCGFNQTGSRIHNNSTLLLMERKRGIVHKT